MLPHSWETSWTASRSQREVPDTGEVRKGDLLPLPRRVHLAPCGIRVWVQPDMCHVENVLPVASSSDCCQPGRSHLVLARFSDNSFLQGPFGSQETQGLSGEPGSLLATRILQVLPASPSLWSGNADSLGFRGASS